MKKTLLLILAAAMCRADVVLEDGTKLRVRLEQTLTSADARKGQEVELSVVEDIRSGDTVVIPQGSRVVGTVLEASPKKRLGRAGNLDFSIDKVRTVDGRYISLRYDPSRSKGHSSYVKTGALMVGIAVFVPMAAPLALLVKGKDVEVAKGSTFDVFTDLRYTLKSDEKAQTAAPTAPTPTDQSATLIINSLETNAEIEIDGKLVGNAPATLLVATGAHQVQVSKGGLIWKRTLEVPKGSSLTLNASFDQIQEARR